VVVDNRKESPTYMQWDCMLLNDKTRKQVLLPPGVGNGFCVLSKHSVFHYKWSYPGEYPDVEDQFTLKWNNNHININWPITNPILSKRDKK
jgi:dTDP-4-dehydrorhamnose 3,5-epimerase